MKRKLNINNLDIGAKSENVDYTNSGMAGVTNIKDAMDNIAGRVNNLENESGGGSSGGGGSQEEQSDIVMYVIGSSSATDLSTNNNDGATHYSTIESVYKILARKLKVKKGNYKNVAVGGQVATAVATGASSVPTNATHVFIQYGANGFPTQSPWTSPSFGDVTTVMAYNYPSQENELKNTWAGKYRLAVEKILEKCGTACKVYVVSQLWNMAYDDTSIQTKNDLYNGWRQKQYDLVQAMKAIKVNGINKYNVEYIRGPLMGIYKDNQTKYLNGDGVHPTSDGARMIAEHILCEMYGYPLDSPVWYTTVKSVELTASSVGETAMSTFRFRATGDFADTNGMVTLSIGANSYSGSEFTISPQQIDVGSLGKCDVEVTVTYTPQSTTTRNVYMKVNGLNVGMLAITGSVG